MKTFQCFVVVIFLALLLHSSSFQEWNMCSVCLGFHKNSSSEDIWLTEIQNVHCVQCPAGLTTNSMGANTFLTVFIKYF